MFHKTFGLSPITLVQSDYVSYEFTFTLKNNLPDNGKIVITFPATPNYCVPYQGFNDISSTTTAKCSISGSTATITQFKAISAGTQLTVILRATNPSTGNIEQVLD
jgi:hypothetical protein